MQLRMSFLRKTDTRLNLSTEKCFRKYFVLKLWLLNSLKSAFENKNLTDTVENSFLRTVIFDLLQTWGSNN